MEEFARSLSMMGHALPDPPFPQDLQTQVDGYRYLGRLAVMGLQWATEFGDPDFPAFHRHDDDIVKWGGPNVDNRYIRARVSGANSYRITGNFATSHGCVMSIHEGDMQLEQYGVYAEMWVDELSLGVDGEFELVLSAERPVDAQNWMPMHPDATNFTIREYFNDWRTDTPGWIRIERIGGEGLAPAPLTASVLASRLRDAREWAETSFHYWNRYVATAAASIEVNSLAAPHSAQGGAKDIAYGFGFYDLRDHDTLIVEGVAPDAWFWNYMLYNHGWMESFDFTNRTSSRNGTQIHIDSDGRYRLVIAHHDPGAPNWIDTCGVGRGMIAYRYVRTATKPVPAARLVPLEKVRSELPPDTPVVTPDERRNEIVVRQRHVARRFRQ